MTGRLFGCVSLALFAVVLANPGPVLGWGKEGHQVVARIAEKQLSAAARAEIVDLVGNEPISDSRIPNFADQIRGKSFYNKKYPNNDKWHFIDIDVDAEPPIDLAKYCSNGLCALDAIKMFTDKLGDPKANRDERREALFFVIHFVGDIHQPLHCANRNDRGGNLLRVIVPDDPGHVTNLHRVWDTNLVLLAMDGTEVLDFANRLSGQINAKQRKSYQQGEVKDWVLESYQLAKTAAYKGIPAQPAAGAAHELGQEYMDASANIVKTQLQKGGTRLAKVLNAAFR